MMPQAGCTALRMREFPRALDVLARFEALRAGRHPWLLDSSGRPGSPSAAQSRYSFLGADPYLVLRSFGERSELEWREEEIEREMRTGDPLALVSEVLARTPESIGMCEGSRGRMPDELPPFLGGAVGWLGYELARGASFGLASPSQGVKRGVRVTLDDDEEEAPAEFSTPDLALLFVDRLIVVDHLRDRSFAVGLGFGQDLAIAEAGAEAAAQAVAMLAGIDEPGGRASAKGHMCWDESTAPWPVRSPVLDAGPPAEIKSSLGEARYEEAVSEIKTSIARGDVYQVNLTQRMDLAIDALGSTGGSPQRHSNVAEVPGQGTRDLAWSLYRRLAQLSPAPFAAYLELPEVQVVSSSPERFLSLDREGWVESRPIKGTRPRGATRAEDEMLAKQLGESIKDRAENLMIVDLVRNDLGRVCRTGSVEVSSLMAIERYANVFQMVSTIRGQLAPERDAADLIRATFPPGSMTGAPKIAAMEIIDAIEPVRRGIYSGAVGYFDVLGGLDLSVVIRTLLVEEGGLHLHGGGAVVSDSDPHAEYLESIDKVRALLAAVEGLRETSSLTKRMID